MAEEVRARGKVSGWVVAGYCFVLMVAVTALVVYGGFVLMDIFGGGR